MQGQMYDGVDEAVVGRAHGDVQRTATRKPHSHYEALEAPSLKPPI